MKRKLWLWFGAPTACAGLSIGSYYWGLAERAPRPVPAATEVVVSRPQQAASWVEPLENKVNIAALQADVAALHAELKRKNEPVAMAEPDAPPDEATAQENEARWREHMTEVDAKYQREARDPAWAQTATSQIEKGLTENEALKSLVRRVECRSETCRVEVLNDGKGVFDKQLQPFLNGLSETLPSMQADPVRNADGTTTMVLYLSRSTLVPGT
jgi:hypothetical protein